MSLRQVPLADRSQHRAECAASFLHLDTEVTDGWPRVSSEELECDCIAHLEAFGFRYYIPALMLMCSITTTRHRCV